MILDQQFSPSKFARLSSSSQNKKMLTILQEVEKCWSDQLYKKKLLERYKAMQAVCHEPEKEEVDSQDLRKFTAKLSALENKLGCSSKDYQILRHDDPHKKRAQSPLPLVLILDNLRSAFNVGSILRNAECFNIKEVACCGSTPGADNSKVQKTSMGCYRYLQLRYFQQTQAALTYYREKGYQLWAMETSPQASSLHKLSWREPIALILGNEALGVNPQLLPLCQKVCQIELAGWKNSLNVAVCSGIALYALQTAYRG